MKTIFLASASPDAPVEFNQRMERLQRQLADMRPRTEDAMSADLVVAVADVVTDGLLNAIRSRCEAKRHLRVFCHEDLGPGSEAAISTIITNARVRGYNTLDPHTTPDQIALAYATLPAVAAYKTDEDILDMVSSILRRYKPGGCGVVRNVC